MSHISEVVFDLPDSMRVDDVADVYRLTHVRLAYPTLEDLPERLHRQLSVAAPGITGLDDDRVLVSREEAPDVTNMVGTVLNTDSDDVADRLEDVRLDIEFGDRPELLTGVRVSDVIPIESTEQEHPRLGKRRQYREVHEEALARRAEGWTECDEHTVERERVHADPTGTGEGGTPPMVDRATAGQGADQITKIYLVNRKEPVLVYGELESVRDAIWHEVGGAPAPSRWVQFQRVNRDAVVSSDDIVINPAYVVSLQSERL